MISPEYKILRIDLASGAILKAYGPMSLAATIRTRANVRAKHPGDALEVVQVFSRHAPNTLVRDLRASVQATRLSHVQTLPLAVIAKRTKLDRKTIRDYFRGNRRSHQATHDLIGEALGGAK